MLTEQQILKIIPVSRTTLFRMMKAGKFPKGVFVSANRRLWLSSEITNWQLTIEEYNPHRARGKGGAGVPHNAVRSWRLATFCQAERLIPGSFGPFRNEGSPG
jgi:predicted DNA-binding transcriptional regulator AlpA